MKFVSVALALLLAVGSHAAAMPQADAPSQLAHLRSVLDMVLTNAREGAKRAFSRLDDAQFAELKQRGNARVDEIYNKIKELQGSVSHVTDSFVSTVADATAPMRESITADVESLQEELRPLRENLREVMGRHLEGYRAQLEPIAREMHEKHQQEMAIMKQKMEPVLAEVYTQFSTNVDETKAAFLPILNAVKDKLRERYESTRTSLAPYAEEYMTQMRAQYERLSSVDTDGLKQRLVPIANEINAKIQEAAAIIMATFQ